MSLRHPANFPESALPPRLHVGAPGLADTGGVFYLTVGASKLYQRHMLTQEAGSPYSEWDM